MVGSSRGKARGSASWLSSHGSGIRAQRNAEGTVSAGAVAAIGSSSLLACPLAFHCTSLLHACLLPTGSLTTLHRHEAMWALLPSSQACQCHPQHCHKGRASHGFPVNTDWLPDSYYTVTRQRPPLPSPRCLPSGRHLAVFWFAPLPGTFVWPPVTITPFPYCRDIVTHKHHHPECQDS